MAELDSLSRLGNQRLEDRNYPTQYPGRILEGADLLRCHSQLVGSAASPVRSAGSFISAVGASIAVLMARARLAVVPERE